MPDRAVLVVEDFDGTRAFIRILPEMKGCHVLEAVNGRDAVIELELFGEIVGRYAA